MSNTNERIKNWAAAWLEKMSIVAIFNGLFSGSSWSFWLGLFCAASSLCLTLIKRMSGMFFDFKRYGNLVP